jgi:hypothetical protein
MKCPMAGKWPSLLKAGYQHTKVTETFDPESQNPIEMQRDGWQAILDNFRKYTKPTKNQSS